MRRAIPADTTGDLPAAGPARERFGRWLELASVGTLLDALQYRAWRDTEATPVSRENRARKTNTFQVRILWRLERADVARVRAAAVAAIVAAGGRVELAGVVATVADGELRITMR